MKLLKCMHCGNIAEVVEDHGVPMVCCGEKMKVLQAGETDGAHEKHVPVVAINGNEVEIKIGEVEHPMIEAHYIAYIFLETNKGIYRHALAYTDKPETAFVLAEGEKAVAAYEYCNLHGLWKKDIK